jgi:hypothetical protein
MHNARPARRVELLGKIRRETAGTNKFHQFTVSLQKFGKRGEGNHSFCHPREASPPLLRLNINGFLGSPITEPFATRQE